MDYPPHIGSMWKQRLWLSFAAILILFSSSTHASEDYVVPEICLSRAVDIGVFKNNKAPSYTQQALKKNYTGDFAIDFEKIAKTYQQTLDVLNAQLQNTQSDIFQYAVDCNGEEEKCHGYFIKTTEDSLLESERPDPSVYHLKNPFNLKIYCDSAIYTSLAVESFNRTRRANDQIIQNKVYDAMNFAKIDSLTSDLDELLNKDLQNYKAITWNAKKNSVLPDMFDFILRKSAAEFSIFSDRFNYRKWIRDFYERVRMVNALKSYEYSRDMLPDFWAAAHSTVQSGYDMEVDLKYLHSEKFFPPFFVPSYKRTSIILEEGNVRRWRNLLHSSSLAELPAQTRIDFFDFLMKHMFFFKDNQEEDFKKIENDPNKFSNPKPRFLTQEEMKAYDEKYASYKKEWGYVLRKKEEPWKTVAEWNDLSNVKTSKTNAPWVNTSKILPTKTTSQTITISSWSYQPSSSDKLRTLQKYFPAMTQNDFNTVRLYLFDPEFRANHSIFLEKQHEIETKALLKASRRSKIPTFFEGFIPYAFSRMATTVLIREMQRYKEADMLDRLKTKEDFEKWSESVVCSPTYNLHKREYTTFNILKFMKLGGTYCVDDYKEHRLKSYDQLYDDVNSKAVQLQFNPENSKGDLRRFIYNQFYINKVNDAANDVNNYCWGKYDPAGYKKTPEKFQSDTNFNNLMTVFYNAAGAEMNGEEIFTSKFQFNPASATEQCFTKGYVFGPEIYKPYAASLKNKFDGYQANLNSKQANDAKKEFNLLSYKETFEMPVVQITKSEMEEIEKKLEQTAWDEFGDLYDILKNPKGQTAFLQNSATYRALAMVDYLRENPSVINAQYMSKFINDKNHSEQIKETLAEYAKTAMFVAGAVSELALLRLAGGGAAAAIRTSATNLSLVFGSAAISGWQIWRINKNQRHINQGVLSKSIDVDAARVLTQINKQKVTSTAVQTALSSMMLIALSGKELKIFGKFVQNFASSGYRFKVSVIMTELDRLALRFGNNASYFSTPEFKKFFAGKLQSNWQEAQEFLKVLNQKPTSIANIIDKAKSTWGEKLPAGIPVIAESMSSTPSWFSQYVVKPIVAGYQFIVRSKTFYNLRFKWLTFVLDILGKGETRPQRFLGHFLFDRLAFETKLVKLLNSAVLSEKNYFSESTMLEIESRLTFFNLVSYGENSTVKIFARKYTQDFENLYAKIVSKSEFLQQNPIFGDQIFKSDLSERLMTREDQVEFLSNLDRKINSRADCYNIIDILDYGLSRRPGVIRQFLVLFNINSPLSLSIRAKNFINELKESMPFFGELWKPQEIWNGPLVYRNRFDYVKKNSSRFFDIGQSSEFLESLKTMKMKEDFSLRFGVPEVELIEEAEKVMIREPGRVTDRLTSVVNPQNRIYKEGLGNDIELGFWNKKEYAVKYFNSLFKKFLDRLSKTIKPGDAVAAKAAFADAYFSAFMRTSENVNLTNICTLPESAAKEQIYTTYRKFLNYVSAGITGVNYAIVYGDRDKDFEWMARGGFEILSRFVADKLFLTPLYANGKNYSQLTRDVFFYPVATGAGLVSDGVLYQLLIQSPFNREGKYETDFANMLQQSDDAAKKADYIFQKFPELHTEMKSRIQKFMDMLENLQNKNLYPGELTEADVIKEAGKQGVIESYFLDKSEKIPDGLLPDQSMYQRLMQLNKMTMNFNTSDEAKRKIINIMTDISFQRNTTGFINPMALDDSDRPWYSLSKETIARMQYQKDFEMKIWPYAILKNDIIFEALCYGGTLPKPAPLILAVGAYVVYKSWIDYVRLSGKKERTNE